MGIHGVFVVGERVHIDADTKDWGRVASDATVVKVSRNQYVQVEADSIRAVVTVHKEDVAKEEQWSKSEIEAL